MKLTRAGVDYHLAILLLAAMGVVSGGTLFTALALALAFSSVFSLALARARFPKSVAVRASSGPVRVLKGEVARMALSVPGFRDPWSTIKVESVSVQGPVAASVESEGDDGLELAVRPQMAGRFARTEVLLRLGDPLGLFYSTRRVLLEGATIDSLPLSLVAPVRRALVPPLVVGESQAGVAGRGQEFYGIEEYTQHSESKDILWSRAAKDPDRPLLARVREANSPESVTIQVMQGAVPADRKPGLVDLQCEALGVIGRTLVLARIRTDIAAPDGTVAEAVDDRELADAIMRASVGDGPGTLPEAVEGPRILVVVGKVQGAVLADSRLPTVLIGWERPPIPDRYTTTFSGGEDLSGLISLVLSR